MIVSLEMKIPAIMTPNVKMEESVRTPMPAMLINIAIAQQVSLVFDATATVPCSVRMADTVDTMKWQNLVSMIKTEILPTISVNVLVCLRDPPAKFPI